MSGRPTTLDEWRDRAIELLLSGKRGGREVIEANAAILDHDRSDDDARTRLAFAYRLEGDYDSAEAVYRQILESAPRGSTNYRTAEEGVRRVDRERAAGSRPYSFEEHVAAVLNADDAYQRASALRDEGKYNPALRWAERGLELAEKQGRAKRGRGLAVRSSIRRAEGKPQLALEDARASVELGLPYEENTSGHVVLAACLTDLGRIDDALEVVENHLERDTDNGYAMNASGRVLKAASMATGELDLLERSESCFRRGAEIDPRKPAKQQLSEIAERYVELGMTDRAADLRLFLDSLDGKMRAGSQRV